MLTTNTLFNWFNKRFLPNHVLSSPAFLHIESTNKCNLRCVMCAHGRSEFNSFLNSKNLSLNEFKHIIHQLQSVRTIELQGLGEPLLNPDLFDIIQYARQRKIQVSFITNGTLLSDENSEKILESGLNSLGLSIDAADKKSFEKIRKGANFHEVIGNIQKFIELKEEKPSDLSEIFVSCVVTKRNIHEIPSIMKLAYQLGIKQIRLSKVQTLQMTELEKISLSHEEFIKLSELRSLSDKLGLTIIFIPALDTDNTTVPCYRHWESLYITAEGFVTPCCYIPFPDIFCFGNIFREDFNDIWNNKLYKNFRAMMKSNPPQPCIKCPSNLLVREP